VCCCRRAVLSRQHVADARAAGRGLVRRRASTSCSRFRLRVEYVMVSTLYARPAFRGFLASRRYGGSCIATTHHRDRRRVRTLRCILLRVKRCYLLTVDREPSRAALSAQFFSVRHAASATASIAMTFRPRHVTSEIAPCRCTAPPAPPGPLPLTLALSCSGRSRRLGGADRSMSDHKMLRAVRRMWHGSPDVRRLSLCLLRTTPQLTGASLCPRP
jgi:hypothetical protein